MPQNGGGKDNPESSSVFLDIPLKCDRQGDYIIDCGVIKGHMFFSVTTHQIEFYYLTTRTHKLKKHKHGKTKTVPHDVCNTNGVYKLAVFRVSELVNIGDLFNHRTGHRIVGKHVPILENLTTPHRDWVSHFEEFENILLMLDEAESEITEDLSLYHPSTGIAEAPKTFNDASFICSYSCFMTGTVFVGLCNCGDIAVVEYGHSDLRRIYKYKEVGEVSCLCVHDEDVLESGFKSPELNPNFLSTSSFDRDIRNPPSRPDIVIAGTSYGFIVFTENSSTLYKTELAVVNICTIKSNGVVHRVFTADEIGVISEYTFNLGLVKRRSFFNERLPVSVECIRIISPQILLSISDNCSVDAWNIEDYRRSDLPKMSLQTENDLGDHNIFSYQKTSSLTLASSGIAHTVFTWNVLLEEGCDTRPNGSDAASRSYRFWIVYTTFDNIISLFLCELNDGLLFLSQTIQFPWVASPGIVPETKGDVIRCDLLCTNAGKKGYPTEYKDSPKSNTPNESKKKGIFRRLLGKSLTKKRQNIDHIEGALRDNAFITKVYMRRAVDIGFYELYICDSSMRIKALSCHLPEPVKTVTGDNRRINNEE